MNYRIWDKIEKINGVEPKEVIESLNIRDTDGVFLIYDAYDNIQAIEIDRIIKSVYELSLDLTTEEVAQEYVRIKAEEKLQAKKRELSSEEQLQKIANLETELLGVKQDLSVIKDMLSELIAR